MSIPSKAPGVPLDSILYYKPSFEGNIVFGALFVISSLFLFVNLFIRKDYWGLCLPIGALCQGLGFFLRIVLINSPSSLGLYIIMDFFIVLSPATYLAFNYIWFGRFVERIEENEFQQQQQQKRKRKHLTFLPPNKFGKIFIISDIVTFLIQASGGGMQVQKSLSKIGSVIFLIGIIAQFVSYIFFLTLSIPLIRTLDIFGTKNQDNQTIQRFKKLIYILGFSSIFILIRSVYRTIELAQGFNGSLSRDEAWLFGLDSGPLLLAIGIYIFFWPCSLVELKNVSKSKSFSVPWEYGFRHSQIDLNDSNKNDEQHYFTKEDAFQQQAFALQYASA